MLRLRKFSPSDLSEIMKLSYSSLGEDYSPSLYMNIYSYWPEGFMVAEDAGSIIGFVAGVLSDNHSARILLLAVRDDLRFRGTGTMLFNAFLNESALRGLKAISLEVRKSNTSAIRFYTRLGFQISGEITKYYSNGEGAYQMLRHL
ncbi:MAG: GNAT family N-acetyltransferase [Thermoplasmata archaeon]|nr:GNAT family N-acetyltransferase [Thermoplasmata archaeon]